MQNTRVRFSVIIPTYQRCALAVTAVNAFSRQEFFGSFEVIVVIDGSSDGTAEALRAIDCPFPLTILEQPNQGAAAARNRGAGVACGDILLFLDDDMEADPRLLEEHDRSHHAGADVVLGHMPLHPASPSNVISAGVRAWADDRVRTLSAPDARLTLHDLLTGQISLRRATFERVGGFDTKFTHDGTFGNEDIDFGYRLMTSGHRILFNSAAVSWQRYVVGPRQHLRQWRQAGRADVVFARKHPEQAEQIFALNGAGHRSYRWLWRPLAACPLVAAPLRTTLRWLAITLVETGHQDRFTTKLFFQTRAAEYWRGVHEAGGMPWRRVLRVLAYHSISDLAGAAIMEPYGIPAGAFRRHLDTLSRFGFRFVSVDEVLHFLHGHGGLPRGAMLLTFDDCFEDLLHVALPILEERTIPAVAFAVSGLLGGTNAWDQETGAPCLRLLNGDGLRELARRGVEIGVHSRTHPMLTHLSDDALRDEVEGAVADLEAIGLPQLRLFAYPYGNSDLRVERAVKIAGLRAAFTVTPGWVRPGSMPYRLSRIEILREDVGWRFLAKVIFGQRVAPPLGHVGAKLRRLLRQGIIPQHTAADP